MKLNCLSGNRSSCGRSGNRRCFNLWNGLPLLNLARPQAAGANQDTLGFPVDDGPDGLQIGHLAAQSDTGNVESDPARLFRFTTAGDFAGLDRSLAANVANLSHCDLLLVHNG